MPLSHIDANCKVTKAMLRADRERQRLEQIPARNRGKLWWSKFGDDRGFSSKDWGDSGWSRGCSGASVIVIFAISGQLSPIISLIYSVIFLKLMHISLEIYNFLRLLYISIKSISEQISDKICDNFSGIYYVAEIS